jgi:E1-E2 ATPase/Cation transporter/ATPase, N-terminus
MEISKMPSQKSSVHNPAREVCAILPVLSTRLARPERKDFYPKRTCERRAAQRSSSIFSRHHAKIKDDRRCHNYHIMIKANKEEEERGPSSSRSNQKEKSLVTNMTTTTTTARNSNKSKLHRRGHDGSRLSSSSSSSSSWAAAVITSVVIFMIASAPAAVVTALPDDDLDWTCPAKFNCPAICVAQGEPCPTYCPDGMAMCADGSCQEECPDAGSLINPCRSECAPLVCPQAVDYLDVCELNYATEYNYMETCSAAEDAAAAANSLFNAKPLAGIGFLWLLAVSCACCAWGCLQRGRNTLATKPLDPECPGQTVTGYCPHFIGTAIYAALVATLVGFQLLIFLFVLMSYGYFDASQTESLQAFEITWSIGFVYTLLFKWPYSIRSIFYKQCRLHEATQVCVYTLNQAKVEQQEALPEAATTSKSSDESYIARMKGYMESATSVGNKVMSFMCCMPLHSEGRMVYLPVQTAAGPGGSGGGGGVKYFCHEFRRYNYNAETDAFEAGQLPVVHTIGDVLQAKAGLTTEQVEQRLRIVGPNVIEMKRPSFFRCLYTEFSKPFYVYQNYMLWTWTPLWYFYLAVIHGSVILIGGFTAAWFTYRNDVNLFKLTLVDGMAECLRDGQFVTINQSDLCPGDVVTVAPGKVYSDMIMLSSQGLLVDESALTGESTPMAKTAVDANDASATYQPLLQHKKHTISAGTTVVESEVAKNNLAVVLSTGSYTSKGKLLREVFSYQRHEFKFDVEVGFVIAILFVQALICFVLVAAFLNEQPTYAWFYGMYVIYIVVFLLFVVCACLFFAMYIAIAFSLATTLTHTTSSRFSLGTSWRLSSLHCSQPSLPCRLVSRIIDCPKRTLLVPIPKTFSWLEK